MRLSTGKLYLFIERAPLRTHQVLRKELSRGRKALYISKNAPSLVKSQVDFGPEAMQMKWLTPRPGEECIPPMNLVEFENYISRFLAENPEGIVVLNGVEVLEMWNGFKPVLQVLKRAQERVSVNGNNLLISLDPKTQFSKNLNDLQKISDEVVSSYA